MGSINQNSFDAWGRSRNPNKWNYDMRYKEDMPLPELTTRGYTGHEHLNQFQLINMNGRLYDPITKQMSQPDILNVDPYSTQSYNRYAYCMNNPFKYTDPSGYIWGLSFMWGDRDPEFVRLTPKYHLISEQGGLDASLEYMTNLYSSIGSWSSEGAAIKGKVCGGSSPYDLETDGEKAAADAEKKTYTIGAYIPFSNGIGIKYDLQDGVGLRSSAQVRGYFSIGSDGNVSVFAEVFHGEKFILYTYNANVRFTSDGKETFIPLSFHNEESFTSSLYKSLGFANFMLPNAGTSVTMQIYIGYEVNTGQGYFNGVYYNETFYLKR